MCCILFNALQCSAMILGIFHFTTPECCTGIIFYNEYCTYYLKQAHIIDKSIYDTNYWLQYVEYEDCHGPHNIWFCTKPFIISLNFLLLYSRYWYYLIFFPNHRTPTAICNITCWVSFLNIYCCTSPFYPLLWYKMIYPCYINIL